MQHIETIEVTSPQTGIVFNSIPQDYDDLVILFSLRTTANSYFSISSFVLNGNTTNRTQIELEGNGSIALSGSHTFFPTNTNGGSATGSTFGNGQIYISNYSATDRGKALSADIVTENNGIEARSQLYSGFLNNNDAITFFSISTTNESWVAGSTMSLYGITAGGSGTVTAS